MYVSASRYSRWLLLALFASMGVLGQPLHYAPWFHFHECCQDAHVHQHDDHSSACHHAHRCCHHEAAAHCDAPPDEAQPAWQDRLDADHTCAICKFFSHLRLLTPTVPNQLAAAVSQSQPAPSADVRGAQFAASYRSRAPPAC